VARSIVDKLGVVDVEIADRDWFVGDKFGPADPLLVTIAGRSERLHLPMSSLAHLATHAARREPSRHRAEYRPV